LRAVACEHARGGVEHLVVGGTRSDSSIKIVRENAASLDLWKSALDPGQSAAINDGMAPAEGTRKNESTSVFEGGGMKPRIL